jgi:hypothetical protein
MCTPNPPLNYDYWVYEIDSIVLLGNCTGILQDELLKRAFRSIISFNNQWGYNPVFIKAPRCIKETTSGSNVFVACEPDECCMVPFEGHWTAYGGELDDIDFTDVMDPVDNYQCLFDDGPSGGQPIPNCDFNCKPEHFPSEGDLETWNYLPPACAGDCYYINSSTDHTAIIPFSGGSFSASYMVGLGGDMPCFGIHSLNIFNDGSSTPPMEVLELLIRKAILEIYNTNGNPSNVRLIISKCWRQVDSQYGYYLPCNDEDCCIIEFEITTNPLTATVTSNVDSSPSCSTPCGEEICSLFYTSSPHSLPKLSINEGNLNKNTNIKIIPNPTDGICKLEFDASIAGIHQLKVVDLRGFDVFTKDINTVSGRNTLDVDLSNIPVGVYYIQVLNNGLMISKVKFMKN